MFQHFKEWELFGAAIPYNYEDLKEDREFLSYLIHIASCRRIESDLFSRSLDPGVRNLIHDIEREIEQRFP